MRRLLSVLFWSVITAAFIGPGTVTTAASAGAEYGFRLGWAVLFSTVACVSLQEASARICAVSGMDVGQALRARLTGTARAVVLAIITGAVVLGCAAYQAGNILGATAGVRLAVDAPAGALSLVIGLAAGAVLWPGKPGAVANAMGVIVGVMGVAFFAAAVLVEPDPGALWRGLVIPSVPDGSSLLILGVVGTTVVPYNVFLGSGLARGKDLAEVRFGILVAVVLGGAITHAIVVVGTALTGSFSLDALAATLTAKLTPQLGALAVWVLPVGLFCAGFSSAITAPLAAAMTSQSLFGADDASFSPTGSRFRAVWIGVLLFGLAFGLAGVQPVPVIILAQAFNGLVLPIVAAFLLLVSNDGRLLGAHKNGPVANAIMAVVVVVSVTLGVLQLAKAIGGALSITVFESGAGVAALGLFVGVAIVAAVLLASRRHAPVVE